MFKLAVHTLARSTPTRLLREMMMAAPLPGITPCFGPEMSRFASCLHHPRDKAEQLQQHNNFIQELERLKQKRQAPSQAPPQASSQAPTPKSPKKPVKGNLKNSKTVASPVLLSPMKKGRMNWTLELHSHFLEVVNTLGINNAVPKTILRDMNVPGLTRENVASHLQKHRQHLEKQKELEEAEARAGGTVVGIPIAQPTAHIRNGWPIPRPRRIQSDMEFDDSLRRLSKMHNLFITEGFRYPAVAPPDLRIPDYKEVSSDGKLQIPPIFGGQPKRTRSEHKKKKPRLIEDHEERQTVSANR